MMASVPAATIVETYIHSHAVRGSCVSIERIRQPRIIVAQKSFTCFFMGAFLP